MRTRRIPMFLMGLILLAFVAGCSGGDEGNTTPPVPNQEITSPDDPGTSPGPGDPGTTPDPTPDPTPDDPTPGPTPDPVPDPVPDPILDSLSVCSAGTGRAGLGHGPSPVGLGTAGTFAILTKAGVTNVPTSAITGDIGVSPISGNAITGFSLNQPFGNRPYRVSAQVTGSVYAANYSDGTPDMLTTAIGDMMIAYGDAAGRAPADAACTEVGAGNISGMTLPPGVYKWGTGLLLTSDVKLKGGPNDVWIFEIAGDFSMPAGAQIRLSGGALAKNVFWQVTGAMLMGAGSHLEGVVLTATAVTLESGASVNGRLLAQTAVTLIQNTVTQPAP